MTDATRSDAGFDGGGRDEPGRARPSSPCSAQRLPPPAANELARPAHPAAGVRRRPAAAAADLVGDRVDRSRRPDGTSDVRLPVPGQPARSDFFDRADRPAADVRRHPTRGRSTFAPLFELTPDAKATSRRSCAGSRRRSEAAPAEAVPDRTRADPLERTGVDAARDDLLVARSAGPDERRRAARIALRETASPTRLTPDATAVKAVDLLRQVRDPTAQGPVPRRECSNCCRSRDRRPPARPARRRSKRSTTRRSARRSWPRYPSWPAGREEAGRCSCSSPGRRGRWTLFKAIDAGKFPKADVTLDHARAAVGLNDKASPRWSRSTSASSPRRPPARSRPASRG